MGQSDDVEDSTYNKHQDLCQKLNMDATAASEAWRSYETIRQNYTLEGDQLHWIGCALYVACRNSSTPTVGRAGTNVEGNCVSLTQLLRLCKLSLIQFFTKSKSWADMANMPQDFRAKIDKLERNFAVSSLIFKKYQPIFTDIFKNPGDDVSRPPRSRRSKPVPCTPAKAFEFCWTLFVCIKAAFPDISDDLVNSYHLLLACCDFIYGNALLANRKDLLNPNFPGLPANFTDENYAPPETANCIVSLLCDRHDAIPVEANVIKEYTLKSHINKFFNEKVLRGDQSTFSGILEALNFEGNSKAINKSYEQHVLSVGDFDERIFLGADASDNIGSPSKTVNVGDLQEQFQNKREQGGGQMPHSAHPVPTASKKYFRAREITSSTPVSTATQSVVRLQTLLAGRQPAPSESLLDIYNSCSQDVKTLVEAKVKELGERFCASYTQSTSDNETALDFGKKRLILAQTLFYKLLEMILNEEKRKKPNLDHTLLMTSLLTNEIFLQCLFACCLEIVIYSYKNEDRTFPWILKALNVEAYNLYKVIEIIVDAEDQLSRDVVKHLHLTEYKILESLAWQSTSPLWRAIESTEGGVPKCEEVALRGSQDTVDPNAPGQPALRRLALDRGTHYDVPQSPVSSASERFQSPVTASGQVKKRLFPDSRVGGQSVLRVGQSVLSQKAVAVDGNSRILFTVSERNPSSQAASGPSQAAKVEETKEKFPRRTGSVALFFRKFYNLACSRMQDLCNSLDITDGDLKLKIWTIFEYSIKERTALMKDRHLDQILMCAVYVICKLARMEKHSFTEIMRCYRLQAQAESHIYRSVLISRNEENEAMEVDGNTGSGTSAENSIKHDGATAPPTPSNMAGTSQSYGSEVRGDLIKFYNTVYVPEVKEFANRLGVSKGSVLNLTLSPLPRSKPLTSSPVRRVTKSVMTRTLDPKAISASPAPQLTYCFSRSPAKDLEAINRMMITVDARKNVGKRLLADDTEMEVEAGETSPAKKTMTTSFIGRKLENIIGEQRTQNQ